MISEPPPAHAPQEMEIAFGIMATPVKPLPTGWRAHTFSAQYDSYEGTARGSHLIYWPDEWRSMRLDPDPTRAQHVERNRAKVARDHAASRRIIPYWTRLHYTATDGDAINPDAQPMRGRWATAPNRPGGGQHQMYRAACTSGWADYLVWCAIEWGKTMGHIDGVYMDETQPIPNTRAESGGGYTDLQGTRRPTFEVFGSRDLIKRITWAIQEQSGAPPTSVAHASATHVMPTLSPYTYLLIGEQYFSGYFKGRNPEFLPPDDAERLYYYSYALPMDRMRAECVGAQWGAVMVWLPCLKDQKDIMTHPRPPATCCPASCRPTC